MVQKKLQQHLNDLKAEISSLDADSETRNELQDLVVEIEDKIEKMEDSQHDHFLVELLETQILKFEVEHPKITAILNDMMLKLSSMGI